MIENQKLRKNFKQLKKLFQFYNAYARACDFSARMNKNRKKKEMR